MVRVPIPSSLALFAAGLSLAGCLTVNDSYTGQTNTAKRGMLSYAGGDSPVLLRTLGPAFGADAGDGLAAATAAHASGAVPGMSTTFTSQAAAAGHPNFRVVVAFDPVPTVAAKDLCTAGEAPPPAAVTAGRMTLFMAFCTNDEALAGAEVEGPLPSGAEDPEYRRMVRAAVAAMFPARDPEREPVRPLFGYGMGYGVAQPWGPGLTYGYNPYPPYPYHRPRVRPRPRPVDTPAPAPAPQTRPQPVRTDDPQPPPEETRPIPRQPKWNTEGRP